MTTSSHTVEGHYLTPEQLQIGLFIHLDMHWMDHPFALGSFKIKSAEQIATLRQLGLNRIRYSPEQSDCDPLPLAVGTSEAEPTPIAEPDPELLARLAAKRAAQEQAERRRALLQACERDFTQAAQVVRQINKQIYARPKEIAAEAGQLVGRMLDSLLAESDIALQLMNDKAASEDLYFHSLNVSVLALLLARAIGLPREQLHELGVATLLHDVGKTRIPDRVLLKTESLTLAERKLVAQHCEWSVEAAQAAGLSQRIRNIILQHHELADGSGYPQKLKLDAIDPLARILAIVNYYDNLCNRINPIESLTPHEALAQMFAQHRQQFDPQQLGIFVRCMGVYPPGSVVQLSNELYAMVVSVNTSRPLKPTVLVHDPDAPREDPHIINLENESGLNISKSLKVAQLPRSAADYLSPRKRTTYFFRPNDEG
ncbi:HD-GYP domain-containing protein [Chitinilyticum piscinae]|uniref:HD-GYP domain-containing protein n=1 Tax=Chitinilyticum piscinae TaxID=2866724 RepID=A0A8J7FTP2_9NEIS|nr:HD-GYP domain-containing protein [Chitinilyticum piscinae]MBE9610371.1 HD-GYP domain-containing protein [Chitinilyticum piscinae]